MKQNLKTFINLCTANEVKYSLEKLSIEAIKEYLSLIEEATEEVISKFRFKDNDVKARFDLLKNKGIDLRIGTARDRYLGTAYCYEKSEDFGRLELHENTDKIYLTTIIAKEISTTLVHEYAHFVAGAVASHGPQWKRVAKLIALQLEKNGYFIAPPYEFYASEESTIAVQVGVGRVLANTDEYGEILLSQVAFSDSTIYDLIDEENVLFLSDRISTNKVYAETMNKCIEEIYFSFDHVREGGEN